ncbi:LLM class flavin-dependent oxidoreductase [Bacillus sp. ISL-47]|uniref:LLM class flavin-dependent oxidoreductase n=1 Tax=Bacillus sp. ISL-47 TaxID=2819130 RepID=UPI001BE58DF4|nr:LLM class flavin-dependent oxidoreductase [Bacillus sp. ISL-47]MBT2689531.1 LLM class flavin-dependent oxidoreductase [Bacillus sp. ISL-47]MBT2708350.1 LLM class flavin-dependent oxidoreductase [Pseudomonas sp. ISL-84]
MKLSILDQAPISSGYSPRDALEASARLAQAGERLGYTRYWIAEHHDLSGLACSAPEIMLSYIGSKTEKIRIGAGAILLPHYKPYKIAELFNMLATLFPNRIDLGIGRAPGGSAEATMALSDNFLEGVRKMPETVKELLHFLNKDFPKNHMFSRISASPVPKIRPEPWILGTSCKSAVMAAENGAAYAFGQFMSEKDGEEIIREYRENFKARGSLQKPKVILTVSAICAETAEEAKELALSSMLWRLKTDKGEGNQGIPSIEEAKSYFLNVNQDPFTKKSSLIIGNPTEVAQELRDMQDRYQADEIMIVTIVHRYEARLRSYELIAKEVLS